MLIFVSLSIHICVRLAYKSSLESVKRNRQSSSERVRKMRNQSDKMRKMRSDRCVIKDNLHKRVEI